jgi:hypothetical protein
MPDQPCHGSHAYQEHDGSGREQEAEESHQQAHYRVSIPTLAQRAAFSQIRRVSHVQRPLRAIAGRSAAYNTRPNT